MNIYANKVKKLEISQVFILMKKKNNVIISIDVCLSDRIQHPFKIRNVQQTRNSRYFPQIGKSIYKKTNKLQLISNLNVEKLIPH